MQTIIDGVGVYFQAFAWFISAVSNMPLLWYMIAALTVYCIICLTWSLILDD